MDKSAVLDACSFCGLQRSHDDDIQFCTTCGRPLLAPTKVRSMDMTKTTANYDPYQRDWKPWKEPTLLKKRPKKKNDSFYNTNAWGRNIPRPQPKKVMIGEYEGGDNQCVQEYPDRNGGIRYRGYTWTKPSGGGFIRRRRKRICNSGEPFDPLLDSDVISPLGVYPANWISPSAVIHISLVEAIRISENNIKTSKCWFRVGVTDSAWGSSPTTGSRLSAETEGLLSSAPTAGDKIVEEQNVYKAKSKDSSQLETDSGLDSPAASIAELNMEKTNNGEEEVDDFLVLQYIDNSVARFIVDRDDDWVDARVIDSKNTYMLEHLQRTLQAMAQRVIVSSSRVAEESYDQLSFIGAKTFANYSMGATLTMSNYFPLDVPSSVTINDSGEFTEGISFRASRLGSEVFRVTGPLQGDRQDMQLYFDQTMIQTTARIPLGGHYRGDYITCMVRVEALNASPSYVSYICKRLDIQEENFNASLSSTDANDAHRADKRDEPVIAALKFLIIPLIMKENIRPKILVYSLESLSVILEKKFDYDFVMYNDEPGHDPKQEFVRVCLYVLETIRFEKVRTIHPAGDLTYSIKALMSGVPNTFDIVDLEDGADCDAGLPAYYLPNCDIPQMNASEETNSGTLTAEAASLIQNKWRESFQLKEIKREEDMQRSLYHSVRMIQCMFRSFKARLCVLEMRRSRPPPVAMDNTPPIIDECWRIDTNTNRISRTCVLRGTALVLKAELLDDSDSPIKPSSDFWQYILIKATVGNDPGEGEEVKENPGREASLKLSKQRLSSTEYHSSTNIAPVHIDELKDSIYTVDGPMNDKGIDNINNILTILTHIMPHLDLFYAVKKGVMILKFNGPEV